MSPSAVGPALVQVKLPPSKFSLIENDADIKLGLLCDGCEVDYYKSKYLAARLPPKS